jgi:hypothetical protein
MVVGLATAFFCKKGAMAEGAGCPHARAEVTLLGSPRHTEKTVTKNHKKSPSRRARQAIKSQS